MDGIVARLGAPLNIISDRDTRFTSHFWARMKHELGSRVALSTTYHPQTNDQKKRAIQIVENILKVYKVLYERKCHTQICWHDVRQKIFGGPKMIQDITDKIQIFRERMKAAQDRQMSYAEKRRRPIEFRVDDLVILKVFHEKALFYFGRKNGW